ncbi:MAG: hypothetical protein RIQ99_891 [Pseudomonadota bacterium]|jgi:uncharacterized protein
MRVRTGLLGKASQQVLLGTLLALTVLAFTALALPGAARAQSFPELTGRVVDAANVIPADEEARLTDKLAALEAQSQRQVVVVTLPDLQGYDISDYGYQLGRHWGVGDKQRNDGALLIVAPKERRVRIEVGYGLEPVLTDGLSALIVQQQIVPRFKAGDLAGGIEAGTDAIINQLTLPPEEARKIAAAATPKPAGSLSVAGSTLFWLVLFGVFFVLPMLRRSRGGRRYHDSGLGPVIMWSVLDGLSRGGHGRGSDWGGGGFSGGGFSGGGGSFGGGGSSGSW